MKLYIRRSVLTKKLEMCYPETNLNVQKLLTNLESILNKPKVIYSKHYRELQLETSFILITKNNAQEQIRNRFELFNDLEGMVNDDFPRLLKKILK